MRAEKGFTLLEVMIALAIFATLAAAVMSASQYVLGQSARVEARLLAGWLADNHLSELHLQSATLALGSKRSTRVLPNASGACINISSASLRQACYG